jgi:outer membrane protein assembly factor BamD (BamD/ComL family)
VQEHEPSRWWFFGRPKRKTPEEQLAYAQRRRDRGKYRSATKHFRAVVRNWPASDEAATAQFEYARMLERRDKYMEAFEAYTELLERYAGRAPHEEVLERQFAIAKRVMHHRRGQFLLFPGFEAPEKAIPLFEKVIKHGPNAPQAPEAQYLVGRAYDMTDQIGMAINAYTKTEYKYPDSEFAEKASFAKAYDLYQLTQESPNDEKLAEGAWAALTLYLNSYPNADNAAEAREYRKALYRRRAKAAYDKAIFYDKLAREPEAALVAYRRFVQQFPHSGWTTLAEIRIQELAAELE